MTNTPSPGVRVEPSTHWTDDERRIILKQVYSCPGHDGIYHNRHMPKAIKRPGMALNQMEREGLLEFVRNPDSPSDMIWQLTKAGKDFVGVAKYTTMTPGGMYGRTFEALDDGHATRLATAEGYKVAEVIDGHDVLIVVVED